jgi:type IV secretion system protein TrbL
MTGRIGAAHESDGARGIARTALSAPAARALSAVTSPVRDAYREGAAQGYRDTAPPGDGPSMPMPPTGGAPTGAPPAWAQSLARRQRTSQAALLAAQAVREGDRPAGGAAPDLKDKS